MIYIFFFELILILLLWKHENRLKSIRIEVVLLLKRVGFWKKIRNLFNNIYCSTVYNYLFHVNKIFTIYSYFTDVVCSLIYGIEYRYLIFLLVL